MSTFSGLGLNTTSASNESNPSIVDKNNKAFVNLRPTSQQDSSSFFHNTGTDAGKYFSPDENPVFIAGTAHDYTDTDSTTKSTLDKIATGVFSKFQIATADSTNPDNSGYTTNWAFENDEINNLKITTPINRSIKITNDNLSGSLYTNRLFFGEEESNYNILINNNELTFSHKKMGSTTSFLSFTESGDIKVQKNMTIDNDLTVNNNMTIDNDLTVNNNMTIDNDLTVNNNMTIDNDLTVNKHITVTDFLKFESLPKFDDFTDEGLNNWSIYANEYDAETSYGSTSYGTFRPAFEFQYADRMVAYIKYSYVQTSLNFTGQHRCVTESFKYSDEKVGYIVSTGITYKHINSKSKNKIKNIYINESLPYINISKKQKDKTVFGVISMKEDENSSIREYNQGSFVTVCEKNKDDNRIYINSVGEGAIWVSDYPDGKAIESGDYITSSDIPGIGMRQDEEMLMNYTVAKITMDCDFNPQMEPSMEWDNESEDYKTVVDDKGATVMLPEYEMKYIKLDGTIITKEEYNQLKSQNQEVYKWLL